VRFLRGENVPVDGARGLRIPFPGSSGRCEATPKDDGMRRGAMPKDDGKVGECVFVVSPVRWIAAAV
jgi:hypothetical protein